jgi:hypothetical protein
MGILSFSLLLWSGSPQNRFLVSFCEDDIFLRPLNMLCFAFFFLRTMYVDKFPTLFLFIFGFDFFQGRVL